MRTATNMDDINLTIDIGGYFYTGPVTRWSSYAKALSAGKLGSYRSSALYGSHSLTGYFSHFRRAWKAGKLLPTPEAFGLVNLQPSNWQQSAIINELLEAA
jgi:hypothetical protein